MADQSVTHLGLAAGGAGGSNHCGRPPQEGLGQAGADDACSPELAQGAVTKGIRLSERVKMCSGIRCW